MAMTTQQWDQIKQSSMEKAAAELRINPIVPSKEAGGWLLRSSKGDGTSYLVKPKWGRSERKANPSKSKGQYWWLLTCTCPAEAAGFVICWHKSAVYLYWKHCAEVGRMEGVGPWWITDGPDHDTHPEPTTEQTTRAEGKAVGQPTRAARKSGTKRQAGTPSASGGRKRVQKIR